MLKRRMRCSVQSPWSHFHSGMKSRIVFTWERNGISIQDEISFRNENRNELNPEWAISHSGFICKRLKGFHKNRGFWTSGHPLLPEPLMHTFVLRTNFYIHKPKYPELTPSGRLVSIFYRPWLPFTLSTLSTRAKMNNNNIKTKKSNVKKTNVSPIRYNSFNLIMAGHKSKWLLVSCQR